MQDNTKTNQIQNWVDSQIFVSNEMGDSTSISGSSIIESSTSLSDNDHFPNLNIQDINTEVIHNKNAFAVDVINQNIQKICDSQSPVANISIKDSTNIHVGNVIKIGGSVIINVNKDTNVQEVPGESGTKNSSLHIVESINSQLPEDLCHIIPRVIWLATDPLEEYTYLEEPIERVIICHTATQSSNSQAGNIGIIRDIQTFHIETRGWNDIAYNFLIGCDGNVYTGRNWGVKGTHTFGYNKSIGISFIGCFIRSLPSQQALNACQNLLKLGVQQGHLTKNYKLLAHCQCIPTESPGRKLYEEIRTWTHFYDLSST